MCAAYNYFLRQFVPNISNNSRARTEHSFKSSKTTVLRIIHLWVTRIANGNFTIRMVDMCHLT